MKATTLNIKAWIIALVIVGIPIMTGPPAYAGEKEDKPSEQKEAESGDAVHEVTKVIFKSGEKIIAEAPGTVAKLLFDLSESDPKDVGGGLLDSVIETIAKESIKNVIDAVERAKWVEQGTADKARKVVDPITDVITGVKDVLTSPSGIDRLLGFKKVLTGSFGTTGVIIDGTGLDTGLGDGLYDLLNGDGTKQNETGSPVDQSHRHGQQEENPLGSGVQLDDKTPGFDEAELPFDMMNPDGTKPVDKDGEASNPFGLPGLGNIEAGSDSSGKNGTQGGGEITQQPGGNQNTDAGHSPAQRPGNDSNDATSDPSDGNDDAEPESPPADSDATPSDGMDGNDNDTHGPSDGMDGNDNDEFGKGDGSYSVVAGSQKTSPKLNATGSGAPVITTEDHPRAVKVEGDTSTDDTSTDDTSGNGDDRPADTGAGESMQFHQKVEWRGHKGREVSPEELARLASGIRVLKMTTVNPVPASALARTASKDVERTGVTASRDNGRASAGSLDGIIGGDPAPRLRQAGSAQAKGARLERSIGAAKRDDGRASAGSLDGIIGGDPAPRLRQAGSIQAKGARLERSIGAAKRDDGRASAGSLDGIIGGDPAPAAHAARHLASSAAAKRAASATASGYKAGSLKARSGEVSGRAKIKAEGGGVPGRVKADGGGVPGRVKADGGGVPGRVKADGGGVPGRVKADGGGVPGRVKADGGGVPARVKADGGGVPGASMRRR